ncbi:FG-GAP-like repeat-containing protein [Occallatibacter riparius]|uniref:FG-GAP-like repeat-containing protein n=1 Tax=Occallatibacter riparius TaxID=1002689 RepID=A0A9J7BQY0_9BACT|nr:FG-GAP-like repeat-containing protein [Occallatibacter riparius]UWZ83342.1 FG-GAP-like repeat-containing protein [Occallatibacter riparius]
MSSSSLLVAQSTTNPASQYFFNKASFVTGSLPTGVALADVNADGRADVIVANQDDKSLSVLLGQTDGTLGPKNDIALEDYPFQLVTGDFNADGKIDVAVSQRSKVGMLLGKGDGTFEAEATYALPYGAGFLATSDVNKDGKPDLVAVGTCGSSCGFVSVLLGKGDGTFEVQPSFSPGGVPWAFTVCDLNKDGIPDLAFANSSSDSPNNYPPGFVSVVIGHGNGTFGNPTSYPSETNIAGIASGDVTGDGIPDIIVSHFVGNALALLKGNGDGTFQPESGLSSDTTLSSQFLQLVDLNRDGKLDLVMSSVFNGGAAILMGNGDGTFQSPQAYFTGSQPYSFTIGDINGDGNVDWIMPDWYGKYLAVLLGNGDGRFSPRTDLPLGDPQTYVFSAATGDFDGDGKSDVAVETQAGDLRVLPGKGNGTFKSPVVTQFNGGSTFHQLIAGDFNKDGRLDLLADGTTFLPGNGNGAFGTAVQVNSDFNIRSFAVGDFNGDGNPDVLDVGNGFFETQPIQLLLGNGDGTFQAAKRFWDLKYVPDEVAVGDFNKDGKLDIALSVNPNGVAIMLGDGTGGFAAPVIYPTDDLPNSITVADLNHDGLPDLIATGLKVDVFLGKGDGTFPNRVDYDPSSFPNQVGTGDFNGDGKLDLAVTGYGNGPGYLDILFGKGDGTFQSPVTFTSNGSGAVVVNDLNGDGIDDVLVAAGTGSLFLSSPIATVSPSILDFGTAVSGAAAPGKSITITNSGNGPLTIASVAATGPFTADSQCGSSLAASANCTIDVTFTPASLGAQSGSVLVTDSAPGGAQSVALSGTGAAGLTISAQTGGSTSATVASGSTASYALAVKASPGFGGTVTLTCGGAPTYAACNVSPSSVPLASGGSGTFSVSITTSQSIALTVRHDRFGAASGAGLLLSALLLPLFRRRSRALSALLGIAALSCLFCLSACGGGGGGSSSPGPTAHNVSPGTYNLTLTASSGSVTTTQSLTLVVR